MPLAAFDAQRFETVSCRPTRCPATSAAPSGKARPSSFPKSFGISAGGFWPSPSSVQTMLPRAARTPLCTAADWPALVACWTSRSIGKRARSASTRSAVSSVEPSST